MVKIKRMWVQLLATTVSNSYVKGFVDGKIYTGKSKYFCNPGMNCYSCPGAVSSCPIGALQAVLGSMKYSYSLYVVGSLGVFGLLFGRFICGFLCPFGWFQDILFKMKTKKYKVWKGLKVVKYLLLIIFVIMMPLFITNVVGIGDPAYCKYICPVGTLQGGLPLVYKNPVLQQAIGLLYYWKLTGLFAVILGSVFFYRPFCKVLCPLGAVYSLFNKISFYQYKVDANKCISCQQCEKVCKMDVSMYKSPKNLECIRCGECKEVCPTKAITSGFQKE